MDKDDQNASRWAKYSNLFVRVCRDQDYPPFQWIYAVDDAWLHPQGMPQPNALNNPVFDHSGDMTPAEFDQRFKSLHDQTKLAAVSDDVLSADGALPQTQKNQPLVDGTVAKSLISFATDRARLQGDDYGVCFCSFEYFFEHFQKIINQPQNAVLFDINHALRAIDKDLESEWIRNIKGFKLFTEVESEINLHGWILHFAMKLGLIHESRCKVSPNHILIVSSALYGSSDDSPLSGATSSKDAFRQYKAVQTAMLNALKSDTTLVPDAKVIDFGFSPLSKTTDSAEDSAELIGLGLRIFDRTFKKSGNWTGVQRIMFNDANILWTLQHKFGHPSCVPQELSQNNWINADDADAFKPLYQFFENKNSVCIRYGVFKKLLSSSLVHRHFESFIMDGDDFEDVEIPSNPSVLWIATFIDFLDNLRPVAREGCHERVKPSLHVNAANQTLSITIRLNKDGIKGLNQRYDEAKEQGASSALLHISKRIQDLGAYEFERGKLLDKAHIPVHMGKVILLRVCENMVKVEFLEHDMKLTIKSNP
jgi:hypothetical protein